MSAILWFRRDLRLHDLPALRAAMAASDRVIPAFVLDERLLGGRHASGPRTQFMLECLEDLDGSLRERGSGLVIRRGRPERELPQLARETGARTVHATADVGPFARRRDGRVRAALEGEGITLEEHPGQFALDDVGEVRTAAGDPYTVFTPFHRAWGETGRRHPDSAPRALPPLPGGLPTGRLPELRELGLEQEVSEPARGGEKAGRKALSGFLGGPVEDYEEARNTLAGGSSRLSPYLHFGCLSPVELESRLGPGPGPAAFRRQLCWRDCSFLTKDLGIDWRWGERWFMRLLIDGDEASNNGNWQWIASVGVDPQPAYRRMLSPARQQERFDPDGVYVRRYVPELADVPIEHLAEPWGMPEELQQRCGCTIGVYPEPIVDRRRARAEALERYRV